MFECVTCGCKRSKMQVCGHCGEWRCPICIEEEVTEVGLVRVCLRCRAARAIHIRKTVDDDLCSTCGWPKKHKGCAGLSCGLGPKPTPSRD